MPSDRPSPARLALCVAVLAVAAPRPAAAQSGWLPTSWLPGRTADATAMFPLAEKDGPWLVLATTFRGDTARDDARRLVHELRDRHGLPAYTHEKAFDYTGRQQGAGLNPDGTPKTMRYANAKQVVEVAVLVGDFANCEDPRGQKTLQKIKKLEPQALGGAAAKGGLVTEFMQANRDHLGGGAAARPPLYAAMLIPNPLLPADYFTRQEVDSFVQEINAEVEYSLLDCPARYTVRVATFSGAGTFDAADAGRASASSTGRLVDPARLVASLRGIGWRDPQIRGVAGEGLLVEAAEKAHRLTVALRRAGWQAWEFHDRDSSIVCVGCVDALTVPHGAGQAAVHPEITRIVTALGPDPAALAAGSVVPRSFDGILLDVQPKPIDVPRAATRRR